MRYLTILILLSAMLCIHADLLTYDKVLTNHKANKDYKEENFAEARDKYQKNSVNNPEDSALHYNLANALYKEGKLDEAEAEYKMALRDKDFTGKSSLYQNLGNIKFQQQDYKNALELYKKSLMADSNNLDSRYNYELAARYLQKQQQQQQNQEQNKDQENKDNDQEQQEQQQQQQQNKEDENKDEKQQQQQQQQNQDDKKEQQQQQQQEMKKAKDKQEAEQMLKALLAKEKEEMKKEKKEKAANKPKKGRYW